MKALPVHRAGAKRAPRTVGAVRETAGVLPVARISVDVSLPHLDRPFDYLVPAADAVSAQPGVRVRVRFAGRLVDGFVLERVEASEHGGRLSMLERVVSPELVLTPEVTRLCRAVADRYAGTLADVLRMAVPPRHGRVEAETPSEAADSLVARPVAAVAELPASAPPASPDVAASAHAGAPADDRPYAGDSVAHDDAAGWAAYTAGSALLGAVRGGRTARAVWQALPGEDWPRRLAEAASVAWQGGRGALLLVPDVRDLARLESALAALLPTGSFVALHADLGPAERYRRFLKVARGSARVVAGTRAAAFAPVRDLALVALFDDGDDSFAEPRAPYPHAREVLAIRSAQQRTALLLGGYARTAEGQMWVQSGWARPVAAPRGEVRRRMPAIEAGGDDYAVEASSPAARARLTPAAFAAARRALDAGTPVLVQVPRRGYLAGLGCADCGRPARCPRCGGPLAVRNDAGASGRVPTCRWCGVAAPAWVCPACASRRLRATVIGTIRTAEEIGRAFPGARLVTSSGAKILDRVAAAAAIVVATPGAEPVADNGYGAALLLDGGLLLGRPDLRAGEETLRRWMAAAALVRAGSSGGRVVLGIDVGAPAAQSLLRWDPAAAAEAELAQRVELGFPPAVAMAAVEGAEPAVGAALAELTLPLSAQVLGPVPVWPGPARRDAREVGVGAVAAPQPRVRALIRVPSADRKALAAALHALAAARSARKDSEPVRIEVDPAELG